MPDSAITDFAINSAEFYTCNFVFQSMLLDSAEVTQKFWPTSRTAAWLLEEGTHFLGDLI